ncbi:serine/threonine protein kinase [Plasmodium fragile]|uniref:Serine/threonine protein kinase n=1 Tax=Plasmodium fragile TaxID=5857 RepID=A0A0D9QP21_PLAFR|nr:serine/threonine protein kinase [Plasmodium fragile]KJP87456.1 serine/threonine protein kinase [Plasmodium fragile]
MQRIRREDYLKKCKNRDDFVYAHVQDILAHQPFDQILEYHNGDVYIGTTRNKKRHGYGFYIYKEIRSVYQGEWIDNAKSGYGTLYNPQGVVYSGEWLNNISHGFGCTYKNEQLFLGTYKFGLINGVGILKKKSSYNFCLFKSNRKKCKIKITKHMDIYFHYYKKDKLFLKENLSAFFPVYTEHSSISRFVRKQIFDHLFGVDISFVQFFTKGRGKDSPIGGLLSYVNYESRINFLKGLISKGAKEGVGDNVQPDCSVGSTNDSIGNSPPKGETNEHRDCNFFPFHEGVDLRGDVSSREAAKGSTKHRTTNEGTRSPFADASVRDTHYMYNSNDFPKCTPPLKLTHLLLYNSDPESESDFCPDVTPSSASSPERHFKVKKKIRTPIRSAVHSNIGAREKRITTHKRQEEKGRRLKLYKLLVGGACSRVQGCGGAHGESSFSNGPSASTAECRGGAQWESGESTQCVSSKEALDRSTLCGKAIAGPRKGMARMKRQRAKGSSMTHTPLKQRTPLTRSTRPMLQRLLGYLKYKNEKNKIECIYQWRSYHIFVFLHLFGLHNYIAAFKSNQVNGFHFFTLNRKMLKMLGVEKNEHIYFLLNFVNAFSSLHNTYLQMLVSWGNIRGDPLVTFSSIPKSELVVLRRLGRHGTGKVSYLCYYANAPMRLKMFSTKERSQGEATRGASGDELDGVECDSSPVGGDVADGDSSPVEHDEEAHARIDNTLLTEVQKFLFDEQKLNNLGESILDGWASIKSNLVNLESHKIFKGLKGGDLHRRIQVEGKKQNKKSEKEEDTQDKPATVMERIQRRTEFMREHFVLSNLRHPNVITYIGNVISRKKEKFGLVFEFLSGMCLHDAIYNIVHTPQQGKGQTCGGDGGRGRGRGEVGRKELTNENIIKLFYEIASALFYLHSKRVVHGSINSQNIFVSEDGGGIKLCNFEKASIECYYDYKVNARAGSHLGEWSEGSYGSHGWPDAETGGTEKHHVDGVTITNARTKRIIRHTPLEGEKMNLPLPYITCMNEIKNINTMMTSPLLLFQAKKFEKRNVRCDDPYAAPEVLREEEYTDKCDIYAFGVVMYEVLFGGLPFRSNYVPYFFWLSTCFHQKYIYIDVNKLHEKFSNRKLFHLVVSNVLLVMRQCLNPEPTCRPDSAYLCRYFGRLVDRLPLS